MTPTPDTRNLTSQMNEADLAAMPEEVEPTSAAQSPELLPFPEWVEKTRPSDDDPLKKFRGYSGYVRQSLLEQGRWSDTLVGKIDERLANSAIESGAYKAEEGKEVLVSDVLAPPPEAAIPAEELHDYAMSMEPGEAGPLRSTVAKYIALRDRQDRTPEEMAAVEAEVRSAFTEDDMRESKRNAVRSGKSLAAVVGEDVEVNDELLGYVKPDGTIDDKSLATTLKLFGTDPMLIPAIRAKLSRPDGYEKPLAEIEKSVGNRAALEALSTARDETRGFKLDETIGKIAAGIERGENLDTWAWVDGTAMYEAKQRVQGTPLADLSDAELRTQMIDLAKSRLNPEIDPENPAASIQKLSTGEVVVPPSVMLNDNYFEKTVNDPSVPLAQREGLRRNRELFVEQAALPVTTIIANDPQGGDEFLRYQESELAEGKKQSDIVKGWISSGKFSATEMYARGIGSSIPEAVRSLVFAIPAMAGNDYALDVLKADQEADSNRRAYAELFGFKPGITYDVGRLVAPVAVDIIVSKGLSTAATTTARATAGGAVKAFFRSATSAETKGIVQSWARGGVEKLAASQATKLGVAEGTRLAAPDVIALAGREVAEKFSTGVAFTAANTTAALRTGGATYATLTGALSQEKNPDGTPKYTQAEVRQIAMGHSVAAMTFTVATMAAFQVVGKAGLERVLEARMNPVQLRKVMNRLRTDVAGITDDATVGQFLKESYRKAVSPMFKDAKDEALEEFIQSGFETINEALATGEPINIPELFKNAAYGAMLGGIMGGTASGIGTAIQSRQQVDANTEADIRRTRLLEVAGKLQETSPKTAAVLRNYAFNQRRAIPQIRAKEAELAKATTPEAKAAIGAEIETLKAGATVDPTAALNAEPPNSAEVSSNLADNEPADTTEENIPEAPAEGGTIKEAGDEGMAPRRRIEAPAPAGERMRGRTRESLIAEIEAEISPEAAVSPIGEIEQPSAQTAPETSEVSNLSPTAPTGTLPEGQTAPTGKGAVTPLDIDAARKTYRAEWEAFEKVKEQYRAGIIGDEGFAQGKASFDKALADIEEADARFAASQTAPEAAITEFQPELPNTAVPRKRNLSLYRDKLIDRLDAAERAVELAPDGDSANMAVSKVERLTSLLAATENMMLESRKELAARPLSADPAAIVEVAEAGNVTMAEVTNPTRGVSVAAAESVRGMLQEQMTESWVESQSDKILARDIVGLDSGKIKKDVERGRRSVTDDAVRQALASALERMAITPRQHEILTQRMGYEPTSETETPISDILTELPPGYPVTREQAQVLAAVTVHPGGVANALAASPEAREAAAAMLAAKGVAAYKESGVTRDATKPEQMTPDEFNSIVDEFNRLSDMPDGGSGMTASEESFFDKWWDLMKRGVPTKGDTILSSDWAGATRRAGVEWDSPFANYILNIASATEKKLPISAEAVDTYGIKLPEGYVKQGDLYVFNPASPEPLDATDLAVIGEGELKADATLAALAGRETPLAPGTRVMFTSTVPGTIEPSEGTVDRVEGGRVFVRKGKMVYPGATVTEVISPEETSVPPELDAEMRNSEGVQPRSSAPLAAITPEDKASKPELMSRYEWMNQGRIQTEISKSRPEVAQPTPRQVVSFDTLTLEGVKKLKGKTYALPGYAGPQLVLYTKKIRGQAHNYVYTYPGGVLLADRRGDLNPDNSEVFKAAVARLSTWANKTKQSVFAVDHADKVGQALKRKSPVSADAIEAYGFQVPKGYVRQGDFYAYQPDNDTRAQPATAQNSVPAEPDPKFKPADGDTNAKKLQKQWKQLTPAQRNGFDWETSTSQGWTSVHAELYKFGMQDGITTLLTNVAKKGGKTYGQLAQLLLDTGAADVRVTFASLPNTDSAGVFIPATGGVTINTARSNSRGAVDTVLHELLHAVTEGSLKNPTPAQAKVIAKISRVRATVIKRAKARGVYTQDLEYALGSNSEFLTHFFTSPEFRDRVAAMTPKAERNWVQVIADMIADLVHGRLRTRAERMSDSLRKDLVTLIQSPTKGLNSGDMIRNLYAGEGANMPQFKRDSLETARAMAAAGKTSEEIRALTGWFPSKYDGKMRWDLPDAGAKLIDYGAYKAKATETYGGEVFNTLTMSGALDRMKSGKVLKLSDIMDHAALFEAYPDAGDIPFFPIGGGIVNASFRQLDGKPMITATVALTGNQISEDSRTAILHEVQHYIQSREGFARGGSANNLVTAADIADAAKFRDAHLGLKKYKKQLQGLADALAEERSKKKNMLGFGGPDGKAIDSIEAQVAKITESVNSVWEYQQKNLSIDKDSTRASLLSAINRVDDTLGSSWVTTNRNKGLDMLYRSLAGEIEARDVQARANLTPEQLAATEPYSSENIAPEDSIVLFQPATARDVARFNQLTEPLYQGRDSATAAEIEAFREANPEAWAELSRMREDVLREMGYDTEAWHGFRMGLQGTEFDPSRQYSSTGTAWFGDNRFYLGNKESIARSYAGRNGEVKKFFIPAPTLVGFSSTHHNVLEHQEGDGVIAGYHHNLDGKGEMTDEEIKTARSGGLTKEMAEKYGDLEEYSVPNPSQIKIADPLTAGTKITPDQWADAGSSDIRFQPATLTEESVYAARLETAKQEILQDIADGTIPSDVKSFEELQDYVDANMYVNDAEREDRMIGPLGKPLGWGTQKFIDFTAKLIDGLDTWLAAGRPSTVAEKVTRLQTLIDSMYESGETRGIEPLEAELEILLDEEENRLVGMDETGDDDMVSTTADSDMAEFDSANPSPGEEMANLWFRWTGRGIPDNSDMLQANYPTFGAFARFAMGDTAYQIQPETTDAQIEEAAVEAAADYERRRRNMTGVRLQPSSTKSVTERSPSIRNAAIDYRDGNISQQEYLDIVRAESPARLFTAVPAPATDEDLQKLDKGKRPKIGAADALTEGTRVGLRLDIPVFRDHGVGAVTIHKPRASFDKGGAGSPIGYASVAHVRNANFATNSTESLKIATGEAKQPLATIEGEWIPGTPESIFAASQEALNDPTWVQIGMNPVKHSWFYDRADMRPVISAEEVLQVGGAVFAKNPKYASPSDPRFMTKQGVVFQPADTQDFTPDRIADTVAGFLPDGITLDGLDLTQLADDVSELDPANAEDYVHAVVNRELAKQVARKMLGDGDDVERIVDAYELITRGRFEGSRMAHFRTNPTALKRLIEFLKEAITSLYNRLTVRYDNGTAVLVNRLARELAHAREGFNHDIRSDRGWEPGLRMQPVFTAPAFYSQLERVVGAKIPARATPAQIMATVNAAGVKAEEIKWSGIEQALQSLAVDGKVPKDALLAYLRDEGAVRFEEVTLGGSYDVGPVGFTRDDEGIWVADKSDPRGYEYAMEIEKIGGTYTLRFGYGDVIGTFGSLDAAKARAREYQNADPEVHSPNATKFDQYVLPGGENYREVVLAMPTKAKIENTVYHVGYANRDGSIPGSTTPFNTREEAQAFIDSTMKGASIFEKARTSRESWNDKTGEYTSSHFPDVPNYVAHMRTNERDGGLFIEEIQSDRHQAGRKKGYVGDAPTFSTEDIDGTANRMFGKPYAELDQAKQVIIDNYLKEYGAGQFVTKASGEIADAPFRTTWPLAMFKRALRDAVAGGKEWVGFSTSQPHIDRWGTERIEWAKQPDGSFLINAKSQHGGNAGGIDLEGEADSRNLNPQNSETVTTEAEFVEAIRPSLTEGQNPEALGAKLWKRMQTEGSGVSMPRKEGFEGFYDNMLPKELGKYVKQWGAKVEKSEIVVSPERASGLVTLTPSEDTARPASTAPIWRIDITPAMRESVQQQGQVLFLPSTLPSVAVEPPMMPALRNFTEATSANSGFLTLYDNDPSTLASADKPARKTKFGRWAEGLFVSTHAGVPESMSNAKIRRDATMRAIEVSVRNLGFRMQKAIKNEETDIATVQVAVGNTDPIITPEAATRIEEAYKNFIADSEADIAREQRGMFPEYRETLDRMLAAAKDDASRERAYAAAEAAFNRAYNANPTDAKAFYEEAMATVEEQAERLRTREIVRETKEETARRKADQQTALNRLSITSPDTFEAVLELRKLTNDLQREVSRLSEDRPEFKAIVDNSMGIHLVRSYQIHQDPKMADRILHPKEPELIAAKEGFIQYLIPIAEDQVFRELERDPEFMRDAFTAGDYDATIAALRKEAARRAVGRAEALFEDFILGHSDSSGNAFGGSSVSNEIARYMKKVNLPEEMQRVLQVNTDPVFNLAYTAMSLGRLIVNQKLLTSIRDSGIESGRFITEAEKTSGVTYAKGRDTMRKVFAEGGNDDLKADVRDRMFVTLRAALDSRFNAGMRDTKADAEEISQRLEEAFKFFADGGSLADALPEIGASADRIATDHFITSKNMGVNVKDMMLPQPGKYYGFEPVISPNEGNAAFRPLGGLYASKEDAKRFRASFKTGRNADETAAQELLGNVSKVMIGAAGMSLGVAVLGNPATYIRNVLGGSIMAASQGVDFTNAANWKAATGFVRQSLKPNGEITPEFQELVAGRIAFDGATVGYLMQLLDEVGANPNAGIEDLMVTSGKADMALGKAAKKGKAAYKAFVGKLSQYSEVSEVIFTVMVYNDFKTKLKEADFGTDKEIMQEASRLTKMVMPSKSERSSFVSGFTGSGLGALMAPFLGFKSENIRNTVNTWNLSGEWMDSDNPVLQKYGRRKRAAMIAVYGLGTAALPIIIQRLVMGITDDEDDAIRASLPIYLRNSSLYYFKDDEQKVLRILNMTYANPISFVTDPFSRTADSLIGAIAKGDASELGEIPAIMGRFIAEDLIGENIVAGKVMDTRRNRDDNGFPIYLESDTDLMKAWKSAFHIVEGSYNPKILSQGIKTLEAMNRDTEGAEFWQRPEGMVWATIAPVRIMSISNEDIMLRAFRNWRKQKSELSSITYKVFSPNPISFDEMKSLYDDRAEATDKVTAGILNTAKAFSTLFGEDAPVREAMSKAKISERNINNLLYGGITERIVFPKEQMQDIIEKHGDEGKKFLNYIYTSRPARYPVDEK